MRTFILIVCLALPSMAQPPKIQAVPKPLVNPDFAGLLKDAATVYPLWERLEDLMRWSPYLCMLPPPPEARMSRATKDTPHARKLYVLYAKDPVAYGAPKSGFPPEIPKIHPGPARRLAKVTQVVVKQAWKPEKLAALPKRDLRNIINPGWGKSGLRPLQKDGGWYRANQLAGLYIMLKLDPKTPDTDRGWVYGTVTPDGKVTSAGRVESCMKCHVKAKKDRLFGIPNPRWAPTAKPSGDKDGR